MTASSVLINNMTGVYANTFLAAQTPDAIDGTLGNRFLAGSYRRIILAFHVSAATTADSISISAGDNPPAFRAGKGALVWTSAAGGAEEYVVGPLETARFKDDDGYINITYPAHATLAGTIECYAVD